jgi:hypothetical protein
MVLLATQTRTATLSRFSPSFAASPDQTLQSRSRMLPITIINMDMAMASPTTTTRPRIPLDWTTTSTIPPWILQLFRLLHPHRLFKDLFSPASHLR